MVVSFPGLCVCVCGGLFFFSEGGGGGCLTSVPTLNKFHQPAPEPPSPIKQKTKERKAGQKKTEVCSFSPASKVLVFLGFVLNTDL